MHYLIPHFILTRLMGILADSKNQYIKKFLINSFIKIYRPKLEESLIVDINDYATYNSFFTRKLKEEARPIESSYLSVVSPVDGTIVDHGLIERNMLIQAKKHNYSLHELLGEKANKERNTPGYFITIYLAPTDYHRIHCPYEGYISSTSHIGESLFSVNEKAQVDISDLYIKNERAVMNIKSSLLSYSLVSVGASIVGSIVPFWFDQDTTVRKDFVREWRKGPEEVERQVLKGQELAYFKMGSTVIIVFEDSDKLDLHSLTTNKSVKFGSKLINLKKV